MTSLDSSLTRYFPSLWQRLKVSLSCLIKKSKKTTKSSKKCKRQAKGLCNVHSPLQRCHLAQSSEVASLESSMELSSASKMKFLPKLYFLFLKIKSIHRKYSWLRLFLRNAWFFLLSPVSSSSQLFAALSFLWSPHFLSLQARVCSSKSRSSCSSYCWWNWNWITVHEIFAGKMGWNCATDDHIIGLEAAVVLICYGIFGRYFEFSFSRVLIFLGLLDFVLLLIIVVCCCFWCFDWRRCSQVHNCFGEDSDYCFLKRLGFVNLIFHTGEWGRKGGYLFCDT